MKKIHLLILLLPVLILCKNEHHSEKNDSSEELVTFRLKGSIDNSNGQILFFQEYRTNSFIVLDTILPDKNGKFSYEHSVNYPAFYALKNLSGDQIILLPGESELITLKGDYSFDSYIVEGSHESEKIADLHITTRQFLNAVDNIASISRDSINSPDYPEIKISLIAAYDSLYSEFRNYSIGYIHKNAESPVSLLALTNQIGPGVNVFDPLADLDLYNRVDSILYKLFPGFSPVWNLHNKLNIIKIQLAGKDTANISKY